MLICHLHSSRWSELRRRQTAGSGQPHLYPACEHLYAKTDAEGFRTDHLTAGFWMSYLCILINTGTLKSQSLPQTETNDRRRCLPGKTVINPDHKRIESLT